MIRILSPDLDFVVTPPGRQTSNARAGGETVDQRSRRNRGCPGDAEYAHGVGVGNDVRGPRGAALAVRAGVTQEGDGARGVTRGCINRVRGVGVGVGVGVGDGNRVR